MKKFLASLLAVMMVLSLVCFASAEQADVAAYQVVGAMDAEGNVSALTEEDAKTWAFVFVIVDDTNCAFSVAATDGENTASAAANATYVVDESGNVVVTLSNGNTVNLTYDADNDQFTYVDETSGTQLLFMNVNDVYADADADTEAAAQ